MSDILDPLYGSLSKEFPLHDIESSLALAQANMAFHEFRRLCGLHTNADLAAIVANRFLLLESQTIVGDHLLRLIQIEGLGSARMRKILYGIWMLRDDRIRSFVLQVIADSDGRWNSARVTDKSNYQFFSQYFDSQKTPPKVRSNFEYFLTESGIYDPSAGTVNLSVEDGWLIDAVLAASQRHSNEEERATISSSPYEFIAQRNLCGIANTTVESLRNISTQTKLDIVSLPQASIATTQEDQPQFRDRRSQATYKQRRWDRRAPVFTQEENTSITRDLVSLERASQTHFELEQRFSQAANAAGIQTDYTEEIDLLVSEPDTSLLIEVKSCTDANYHSQVRRGIAQLLEYEFRFSGIFAGEIQKVLLLEIPPPAGKEWLWGLLDHLSIIPIWIQDGLMTSVEDLPKSVGKILGAQGEIRR